MEDPWIASNEAGSQKDQLCESRARTFGPITATMEGRGWRLSHSPVVNDLIHRGYIMNLHKIPANWGSGSSLTCGHMAVLGRWHDWRGMEVLCHPVSSMWLFLTCSIYNKLVNLNKAFSWVLWVILPNDQTEEGVVGNPWLYSQLEEQGPLEL